MREFALEGSAPVAWLRVLLTIACVLSLQGCIYFRKSPPKEPEAPGISEKSGYLIGPGDQLQVFVWRNNDLTVTQPVRPDGRISIPLLQDVPAAGRTPEQLAADVTKSLSEYVEDPQVTVIVLNAVGSSETNIRVVGASAQPRLVPYQFGITLLDAMVDAGGLTEFADGNRASLVRNVGGKRKRFHVRLASLLKRGDLSANVQLAPGDLIVIPERLY